MVEKGFYFAAEEREEVGFSFSVIYVKNEKDFQVSIMLGNYIIAIGYSF